MGLSGMGFVAVLFALLFVIACGETATPEPEPVDCSQAKCTFSLSHEDRCFVTIEGEDAPACDYPGL